MAEKTATDIKELLASAGGAYVKVGVFDLEGVMRGKYMHRDKFLRALDSGFGFCDVVLGWDLADNPIEGATAVGWHKGFPDAAVRLLPETARPLPAEPGTLLCLGEFAGDAEEICPRGVLRRVLARAAALGFQVKAGFEYEFIVFAETPHSAQEKGYRGLTPMAPGMFGYSVLRNSAGSGFYQAVLETCAAMEMPLEGLHEESGPGILEAALRADTGLAAADRAALFKTFSKVVAQSQGLLATFMARWDAALPGSSGHVHLSLQTTDGSPAFFDGAAAHGISGTMAQFVAGQRAYMGDFLALVAPTVNSYRRLVPGYWAPSHATWGVDNRTVALRVIDGRGFGGAAPEQAQRVEYRVAGADANPYLALAAAVASGLAGIEGELDPGEPVTGDAYQADLDPATKLPGDLAAAADRLAASEVARAALGDAFVDHFVATRRWEAEAFAQQVGDWELARYFEIV